MTNIQPSRFHINNNSKTENDLIELQVGVKIFLRNPQGKHLLLHRNSKKYPEIQEKWDIVGGRIDLGVSLIQNLRREVQEETQFEIIEQPILIAAQDILCVYGRHVVRLTYIGKTNGEPTLHEEHIDYKWCTIEEMKERGNTLDRYCKELLDQNLLPLPPKQKR